MITSVKIGPMRYEVISNDDRMPESDTGYRIGEIDYERLRIRLKNTLNDQVRIQTLWHEIIHGILNNAGSPDKSQMETIIDAVATGIIQVLRDNPELAHLTLYGKDKQPMTEEVTFDVSASNGSQPTEYAEWLRKNGIVGGYHA